MLTPYITDDSVEFRRDSLVTLLVLVTICWSIIHAFGLIYAQFKGVVWPHAPMLVVLSVVVVADQLRRHQHDSLAAKMLIGGLIGGPALFLWMAGPGHPIYFFLLIPVVAASVLIGGGAEFAVAMVNVAVLVVLSALWQPHLGTHVLVGTLATTWAPSLACVIIAVVAHLNARNIATMVRWAVDSQQKDARRAQLFYEQSEQLRQTLLQLEHAHGKLQLLNAELIEARRIAEAANRLKTQFLANVSHELRTPLAIIMGYSQPSLKPLNAGQNLQPDVEHDLQCIHQNAAHLNRLINDLLDLSRVEMDALQLVPEEIEPRSFLKEVFHSIIDSAQVPSQVEWRLDLPAYLPYLQADPVRLRQIVLNLLSNAAKWTEHGHITLGAEIVLPHLHLWVADTGCGIPIDLQEQIFDPFVTDPHATQRREGIGLGLSIARRLVTLHHGSLTLESQPGSGSTFHVYLPLTDLLGQPAIRPASARPVLLLLTAHDQIAPEIAELSRRQDIPLHRIGPGADLAQLLAEVQPVGIIWETSQIDSREWTIMEQLRSDPQLCQIPVMVYRQRLGAAPQLVEGLTSVVIKPVGGATLIKAAYGMQQSTSAGPICIIDDDPQARDMYAYLLAEAFPDRTLVSAENGAVAIEMLAQITPSLVILDLMMPEVDGFGVLEYLRSRPETRRTPVLVLSGQMLSIEDVERLNYAAVTFHTKEMLGPDELRKQMGEMLPGSNYLAQLTSLLVKRAIAYIHQNYAQPLAREDIAAYVGVSERYLTRIFQAELKMAPGDYLTRYRMMLAKQLLRTSSGNVSIVATQVGFDDPAYFSRVFRKEVGQSPSAYRDAAWHRDSGAPLLIKSS